MALKPLEGPQQLFAQLLLVLWLIIMESFKEAEDDTF
jgi:hypothetical protein